MPTHTAASSPSVAGTPMFVGRATLLRTLQTHLPLGRSYAVLAGPKTGRTSLLQQFAWLEKEKARKDGATSASWVPVYIDLRAARPVQPKLFFEHLYQALCKTVLDPWVQGTDIFPRAERIDFKLEKNPAERFAGACETLWNNLANTRGWCRWALVCDNAEALAERGVSVQVADTLLAMCDAQLAHRPTSMLWVGAPPLGDLLGSQGLASMRRLPMGVLRDAEAQALYRAANRPAMPPDAPWEVCVEASGRHPMILSALIRASTAAPDASFDEVRAAIEAEVEAAFASYLALMGPMADTHGQMRVVHALMEQLLGSGSQDMSVVEAEQMLGMRPVKDAVDMLESFAVLERTIRGNTPTLRAGNPWWNSWYLARRNEA